jgi:hypothetical protein
MSLLYMKAMEAFQKDAEREKAAKLREENGNKKSLK